MSVPFASLPPSAYSEYHSRSSSIADTMLHTDRSLPSPRPQSFVHTDRSLTSPLSERSRCNLPWGTDPQDRGPSLPRYLELPTTPPHQPSTRSGNLVTKSKVIPEILGRVCAWVERVGIPNLGQPEDCLKKADKSAKMEV